MVSAALVGLVLLLAQHLLSESLRQRDEEIADYQLRLESSMATNLEGVDLVRRQLPGIYLRGKNMRLARLDRANLEGANLFGTDLSGARLQGANLTDAYLGAVVLGGTMWNEGTQWPSEAFREFVTTLSKRTLWALIDGTCLKLTPSLST